MITSQRMRDDIAIVRPSDASSIEFEMSISRNVDDIGVMSVGRAAIGLRHGVVAEQGERFGHRARVFVSHALGGKFSGEIIAREEESTTGVFFFGESEEVGRVADLCLHLFFAVTEIIVGDHGHDHAIGIAAGGFKRTAVVVEFVGFAPAHTVALLALGGVVPLRKSKFLFGEKIEVRREHHAAGVAAPMLGIEGGIVFG